MEAYAQRLFLCVFDPLDLLAGPTPVGRKLGSSRATRSSGPCEMPPAGS